MTPNTNAGLPDRLLNASEAAEYLGYSEGTVRNKASEGVLPYVKLGTALRFRLSELDAWIAEVDAAAKERMGKPTGAGEGAPEAA